MEEIDRFLEKKNLELPLLEQLTSSTGSFEDSNELSSLTQRLYTIYISALEFVHNFLEERTRGSGFGLRSGILALFSDLQSRAKIILYPKKAKEAYCAGIKEIHRRSEFKNWFLGQLHSANQWLNNLFQEEDIIRQNFLRQWGQQFPITLAPALRESMPDWNITFPEFDKLPQLRQPPKMDYIIPYPELCSSGIAESKLQEVTTMYENEISKQNETITKLENEKFNLETSLNTLEEEKSNLQQKITLLDSEVNLSSKEISDLNEKISQLTLERDNSNKQLEELKKEFDNLTGEKKVLETKLEVIKTKEKELNVFKIEKDSQISKLTREKQNAEEQMEKMNEQIKSLKTDLNSKNIQIIECKENYQNELQELKNELLTHSQLITSSQQQEKERGEKLNRQSFEIAQLKDEISNLKRKESELLSKEQNLLSDIQKMTYQQQNYQELQKLLKEEKDKNASLSQELIDLNAAYEILNADFEARIKEESIGKAELFREKEKVIYQLQQQLASKADVSEIERLEGNLKANMEVLKEERNRTKELYDKIESLKKQPLTSIWPNIATGKLKVGDQILCLPCKNRFIAYTTTNIEYILSDGCFVNYTPPEYV